MPAFPGRRGAALTMLAGLVLTGADAAAPAPPDQPPPSLSTTFARAAHEFSVPEAVLLAVSYEQSRWDAHDGLPSVAGGFGPMHLTDRAALRPAARLAGPAPAAADTLPVAAALLGLPATRLRREPAQNVRGGAALLARYERELTGGVPSDPGRWYAAVARYSGAAEDTGARAFADDVYALLREGASRTTDAGGRVELAAQPAVRPDRSLGALHLRRGSRSAAEAVECPAVLACDRVPAGYAQTDPADKTKYGNYARAARPGDGNRVRYVVVHDTEASYALTLSLFADPTFHASAHYVVRAADGHVTQMVPTRDVAWHAANSYVNAHSVGIEHEGAAVEGATWFTEAMYRSSARLVRYLARRYRVPLDRAHVLGHDDVPAPTQRALPRMHWDPGPYWDWDHYLHLLRGRPAGEADASSPIVAIAPRFATNQPPLTDCDPEPCRSLPQQPASVVPLRAGPSDDAPLIGDPALGPDAGTTRVDDLRDKASVGQRFVVARRRGAWTAIWFGGREAWFHDPGRTVGEPAHGRIARPRPGVMSVPVYGRPLPEPEAYPPGAPAAPVVPLPYVVPAGQAYVAGAPVRGDVYLARSVDGSLPGDRTLVRGHARYYPIEYNHRLGFVRAEDVTVEQR